MNPEQSASLTLVDTIRRYPGKTPGQLGTILKWPRQTVINALTAAERAGYLLYEDDKSGLYLFNG